MEGHTINPRMRRCGEGRSAHITRVASDCTGAFWEQVAESFPDIKHGDVGPEESHAIEAAMRTAVEQWLTNNTPAPTIPQLDRLAKTVLEAGTGAYGVTYSVQGFMAALGVPGKRSPSNDRDFCIMVEHDRGVHVAIVPPDGGPGPEWTL